MSRSLEITKSYYKNTPREYEQETSLIRINPANGSVTVLARSSTSHNGMYSIPVVAIFKGKIAALFSMWLKNEYYWSYDTEYHYALH
jgi:hypothetical protein